MDVKVGDVVEERAFRSSFYVVINMMM